MSTKKIKALAPAKINLYLKVLNKRPDGYHNIQSIFQPIGLYDELEFEYVEKDIQVSCNNSDILADDNLVKRAALLLQQKFAPNKGIKIVLNKQIPIGAGLGGGSSDAATTLCTLNKLWELNLAQEQLLELGLQLGSDVPFFIVGKSALVEGIGDIISPWTSLSCWVVLVKPNFSVSTAWAYQNLNAPKNKGGLTKEENYTKMLKLVWANGGLASIGKALYNDFESTVALKYPLIEEIKQELASAKAAGVLMSGSGSSVYGLFAQQPQARYAFNKLKKFMQERGVVFLVSTVG